MSNHDCTLGTLFLNVTVNKGSFLVASISVRCPVGLPWVIRLQLVLAFHLQGDNEVGGWIRISLTRLSKLDVAGHVGGNLNKASSKIFPDMALQI